MRDSMKVAARYLFPSAVVLAALVASSPARAEEEEEGGPNPTCGEKVAPDRPGATNSHEAMQPGCLQLELSTELSPGSAVTQQSFPTALRLGLAEHLEVRLESPWAELSHASTGTEVGRGDLSLGVKYTLVEAGGGLLPGLGLLFAGTLPGAAREVAEVYPRLDLLADWELPAGLQLGVNVGVEYVSAFTVARDVNLPLAAVLQLTVPGTADRVGVFVDSAARYAPATRQWDQAVGGGIVFLATPALQLDLSGSTDLSGGDNPWWVALGLSWAVPL